MINEYGFEERLEWSHGISSDGTFHSYLMNSIPGATEIVAAQEYEDRRGTDWWVYRKDTHRVSVDVKVRDDDPIARGWGDDLALETWSVMPSEKCPSGKVGWTRDSKKETDYVMWYFRPTSRCCLVPFPMLCNIFSDTWIEWKELYKTSVQQSDSWKSECVFVPRREIWACLYRRFGGAPGGKA